MNRFFSLQFLSALSLTIFMATNNYLLHIILFFNEGEYIGILAWNFPLFPILNQSAVVDICPTKFHIK